MTYKVHTDEYGMPKLEMRVSTWIDSDNDIEEMWVIASDDIDHIMMTTHSGWNQVEIDIEGCGNTDEFHEVSLGWRNAYEAKLILMGILGTLAS